MTDFYTINKQMEGMPLDHVIQEYLQSYENIQNLERRASRVKDIKENIPKLSPQRVKANKTLDRIYENIQDYDKKIDNIARVLETKRNTPVESLFSNPAETNRGFYAF